MSLEEEVSVKIANDPRWKELPYEYAYLCISLGLTFQQSWAGFLNRQSPEQIYFREMEFTEEKIRQWNTI